MGKNKGKGGKTRRRGKNQKKDVIQTLEFREEGQDYAKVTKMLGNGRVLAYCFTQAKEILCIIRGSMRKKIWISVNDYILVGLRDYQESKADVIAKYSDDEVRKLKQYGELVDTTAIKEYEDNEIEFEFDFDKL